MLIKAARMSCGDPEAHVVPREGELDLSFTGWEMGHGTIVREPGRNVPAEEWTRSAADVRIYLTAGGQWVAQVEQHLPRLQQSEATVHDTAEEMYQWLTMGGFEEATKRAWEGARQALPSLPVLELRKAG